MRAYCDYIYRFVNSESFKKTKFAKNTTFDGAVKLPDEYRCPKCGSCNIVKLSTGRKCFDCLYEF